MDDYELINNKEEKQYEFHVDNYTPKIEYIINAAGDVYLTHTEVPRALEGQGVGTQLVGKVLADIRENGQQVVPMCPFVAAYIRKNPEWRDMVAFS